MDWVVIVGIVFTFVMLLRIVFMGNALMDLALLLGGLFLLFLVWLFAASVETEDEKYVNIARIIVVALLAIFLIISAVRVFG